jgi:hypothetical protein
LPRSRIKTAGACTPGDGAVGKTGDDFDWPAGESPDTGEAEAAGPTFTGYFLAKSFAAGLRLEHSGADLWNAFVRAHAEAQLTRPPEIQMDYFTRAVESLLGQGNRFDDSALALNESYWTQAVEESGYVGAQRSVAPALG